MTTTETLAKLAEAKRLLEEIIADLESNVYISPDHYYAHGSIAYMPYRLDDAMGYLKRYIEKTSKELSDEKPAE